MPWTLNIIKTIQCKQFISDDFLDFQNKYRGAS